MNKKKKVLWIVKRSVVEYYQVEASSRKEAIEIQFKWGNPYRVDVIKVSTKRA